MIQRGRDLKDVLEVVEAERDLGVVLSNDINAFKTREPNTIKTLYTTYIRPRFERVCGISLVSIS
jgi:hypothetical protein